MKDEKPKIVTSKENNMTLQFDLYDEMKFFTIVFEAVSEKRNLLKDVILDEFHLDICDLQRTHPVLYNKIKTKMERKAKDFWTATGVPTLDRQIFHELNEVPTLNRYKAKTSEGALISQGEK